MKSTMICLAATALAVSASAQMRDNRDKTMTCDDRGGGDRVRHCDIRELPLAAGGRLDIDAGTNGGATIKGWLRNDVLVRARVDSWAETDAEASSIAGQVHVDAAAGQVKASGPESRDGGWWAVSYEIFVPQNTDLKLKTHNGGVNISDIRGRMEFDAMNGGVHLARIAGDVTGATVNGGVHIDLAGSSWDGRQLEVTTKNGGVTLSVPQAYSAHIQTDTVNGGVRTDFPVAIQGKLQPRNLDFNLGSGGPLIHVSTTNGGVNIKRL
jgi:DUF4097 and DUF4098 domain-containing protein YvlB